MKRISVLILAIVLVFSFSACSTGGTNSNSGGNTGGSNNGGSAPVTIKVWIQAVNQPQYFAWVKKAFEAQNKNINLKIEIQTSITFGTTLTNSFDSANGPDVSATWGGLIVPTLYAGKSIMNLSDVVTSELENKMLDVVKYNKSGTNNEWYCLPLSGFSSPTIFYNKTAFNANGWKAPTTYQDLKTLAASIRAKRKQPLVSGFGDAPITHFMQAMSARTMSPADLNKTLIISKGVNPFDNVGFRNGFSLLLKYKADGIFADNITGFNANSASSDFINQTSYMYAAPSLELLSLNDAVSFELGAFYLPPSPEAADIDRPASVASGVYSDVFVVNAKTKYPSETKKLMKFLLTDEAQQKLLDYYLYPVYKTVDTSKIAPEVKPTFDAVLKPLYEVITQKGITGFYQSYSVGQIDGRVGSLAQSVLNGSISPDEAKTSVVKFYDDRAK